MWIAIAAWVVQECDICGLTSSISHKALTGCVLELWNFRKVWVAWRLCYNPTQLNPIESNPIDSETFQRLLRTIYDTERGALATTGRVWPLENWHRSDDNHGVWRSSTEPIQNISSSKCCKKLQYFEFNSWAIWDHSLVTTPFPSAHSTRFSGHFKCMLSTTLSQQGTFYWVWKSLGTVMPSWTFIWPWKMACCGGGDDLFQQKRWLAFPPWGFLGQPAPIYQNVGR